MTCEELLKALNDFVDGAQLTEICDEFAEHLAGCNPCQIVIDNIRQTITLYKSGTPYVMPQEFTDRLHAKLKLEWDRKFQSKLDSNLLASGE